MLKKMCLTSLLSFSLFAGSCAIAAQPSPLIITDQGSFAVGGSVIQAQMAFAPLKPAPSGQTLHGDHAYVFYQIPAEAKKHPLVFLHGAGQFSKTWESTPDGRDGFQNIFLRKGYGVYLLDQPRRGNAGRSTVSAEIKAAPDEQFWFGQFRLGLWPEFFPGSQFSGEQHLDQFFRQMTPNTGPYDAAIISDAVAALFRKTGSGILVTHSQGCGPGWLTAIKAEEVTAIVAYEPGSGFVFPEGEVPAPVENNSFFGPLKASAVPLEQFKALTKLPIIIYYGDNIPQNISSQPYQEYWRAAMQMARLWADAVNRHGGDASVVFLPDAGLKGNTHFPFSDLNNGDVAELLEAWLKSKGLDRK